MLKNIGARLGFPVVVKPARLGSSIGITIASDEEGLKEALANAFELDARVLIEPFLKEKQDVNCAAYMMNGEIFVSEPESAFGEGVYSFEEKYVKRKAEEDMAWKGRGRHALNADICEKIRAYTKTIYKRMGLNGVVRMDFLVSEGKAYLCEVNTVPGSLAYYLFCERVTDAQAFFGDLLEEAIRANAALKKKTITTGILKTVKWQGK